MQLPLMDTAAKGWMINTARDNYWRVEGWCEWDDLLQDGQLCYYRVLERYISRKGRVRPPKLIMALFKTTFMNHIHGMAKYRIYCPATFAEISDLAEGTFDAAVQYCDEAEMDALIAEAPPVVQHALKVLLQPDNGAKLKSPYRIRPNGHRETFNERLCRIVGYDPSKTDLQTDCKNYLLGLA